MHGEWQEILTRHQQLRKMSSDASPQHRKWVSNKPQDLPSSPPHCAFSRWFKGMAPRAWQRRRLRKMKGCFYACSLSLSPFFLFVPSQVITINCAMRAGLRWVYREASTNPSSAFSPSFLEAIAYHIFTVLLLTARIKADFTTQPLRCPSLPPPKWGQKRVIGLWPAKSDICGGKNLLI